MRSALARASLIALAALAGGAAPGPGSLDRLAEALVERARPQLERAATLDVAVAVAAPWPRLQSDLGDLIVARLRALGVRSAEKGGGDAAWARARGFERVLRVEIEPVRGKLRATGTVLAVPGALWSDEVEARAHLYAEAPLDDELKAYLPAGPQSAPGAWQARGLPVGDLELLALDVGDSDGDGRAEVVGATATELIAWSWDGARLLERWRARLDGKPAAIRPRADLATVAIADGGGALVAHAAGFEAGVRRGARPSQNCGARPCGAAVEPARGFAFPGVAGACELEPGTDWFSGATCGASASLLPERFWSAAALRRPFLAAAPSILPSGAPAIAAVVPGGAGGTLWLRAGAAPPVEVRGVGAQVALASLDRGDVVVTSEPSAAGEPDALVIRALAPGAPVLHRVDRLPGAIRAIGAGDVDGDGQVEIVAAVRDDAQRKTELWIVR